ncbi:MAG: cell wall hydrolase [Rhodospirillales bacterium]|nr:cell wall hydrolase [Alphaproteobacteria bacterium]USO02882.1 MAG: cell wall hydrolase [Rhodospirillales bacterium]
MFGFLKLLFRDGEAQGTVASDFYREMEVDVLARTLWGEARGEGERGMEAVAAVVLNRVNISKAKGGYWWGNDIIRVCQKPYQFSCWNRSDPSYKKLQAADEKNARFVTALEVARRAASGTLRDPTGGATHYHAAYVAPYWAKGEKPTAIIGQHIFYKLIEV